MNTGRVLLVFYCFLYGTPNVEQLIISYLNGFIESKLLHQPFVDFIISLSGENNTFFEQISKTIQRLTPTANITWSHGSTHEYPGIYTIWSKSSTSRIILLVILIAEELHTIEQRLTLRLMW
jgi:hypothetical protein